MVERFELACLYFYNFSDSFSSHSLLLTVNLSLGEPIAWIWASELLRGQPVTTVSKSRVDGF